MEPLFPSVSEISANQPIFFDKIILRYGNVLKELSPDSLKELKEFCLWMNNHKTLWSLIKQKTLPKKWFFHILKEYALSSRPEKQEDLHPQTMEVFRVLYKNGRLEVLPQLLGWIEKYQSQKKTVHMYTATHWTPEAITQIVESVETFLGTAIDLHISVKPDLILGGMLLWDNQLLDLSFQRIFNHLQREIIYV